MNKKIEVNQAAELASNYFGNGYHCAEAIVAAIMESIGDQNTDAVAYATAFGGGVGESFTESCGVVSGGLLVIGHLHGRRKQGESWKDAAQMARKSLQTFVALHGTTNCGKLRDRFGEEEQMSLCRELVSSGTKNLVSLINQQNNEETDECLKVNKCGSCA